MFYLSLRYLPWVAPTLGIFANAYATASGAIGFPGRLSNSSMIFSRQKISASESLALNNDLAFRLPIRDSSKHVHKSRHAEG